VSGETEEVAMSVLAIESVQAHIDDLQREAAARRRVSAARRVAAEARPAAPARAFLQVRRALGARV
jgi:hypothetical protein